MFTFKSYGSSSKGNAHVLAHQGASLLLDCGVGTKALRRAGVALSALSGGLVTHAHQDHSKGCADLMRRAVDVYLTEDTREALGLSGHRLHVINPNEQFDVGPFNVLPFPLVHDVPTVGFLIRVEGEKAVYITDTAYCRYTFPGVALIAVECNYCESILEKNVASGALSREVRNRIIKTHFGLKNVLNLLRACKSRKLQEVHLLHLSSGNSDEHLIKSAVQGVVGCPVYVAAE